MKEVRVGQTPVREVGRRWRGASAFVLAALAVCLCAGTGLAASDEGADRPNLLLLMTDDQRRDAVGYASEGPPSTPHLDRLAEQGMVFTRAYTASMPCVPSRASLMTGLHHPRWPRGPRYGLGRGLSEEAWTWAEALAAAGYRTALFGKMHFSPRHADHGFAVMKTCDHPRLGKGWEEIDWHDDYDDWLKQQGLDHLRAGHHAWKGGLATDFEWPAEPRAHPIAWVRDRAAA